MSTNILKEMLLIEDPSVFKLYSEMTSLAGYFVAPLFTIALILEYFGDMNFGMVVKKLVVISIFMGAFYQFHTNAVDLSLETASYTLKKVSPRNLFVKKWYEIKVRTKQDKGWSFLEKFAVPNLNDLLATAFFLLAKVFIWLLKLIYSTVYHLAYVFSGITAILYFLGWTKDALKGTIQASLWCMLLPFVIVAILSFVGNSFDLSALRGEFVGSQIDTIIWLFGVTLLLLISPLITQGLIKGDGVHSAGAKVGSMLVSSGMKTMTMLPPMMKLTERVTGKNLSFFGSGTKNFKPSGPNNLKEPKKDSSPNQDGSKETKSNQRSEVKSSEGKVETKGQNLGTGIQNNKEKTLNTSNSSKETRGGDKTQTKDSVHQSRDKIQTSQKNNVNSTNVRTPPKEGKSEKAQFRPQPLRQTKTDSKTQFNKGRETKVQSSIKPHIRSVKRELR
ncbi:MAG: hypothetical protein K2P81_00470 [Bacteriovoracaceae bacterium]|nr:hypothetical protein [Bacteriovoracaceae bacterium]